MFLSPRFRSFLWVWVIAVWAPAWVLAQQAPGPVDPKTITIHRDAYGVPHIFAPTDVAAAYGLAWVQAEDCFDDVQDAIILARGRNGELRGIEGAKMDFFRGYVRADLYTQEQLEADVSPQFRAYLAGFAQGLNDYVRLHPEEEKLKGLFPVKPLDVAHAYIVVLSVFVQAERALGAILGGYTDKYSYNSGQYGSNAMAYKSTKTADGKTWLVLNPHVPLKGSFSFYEANVYSAEGWQFHGALFPGSPCFGMGVNPSLGWAMTSNWPKYTDIFKLRLNPKNKYQYWYDGKWLEMERRQLPLKVKLGKLTLTVKRELLNTVIGPAMRDKKGDVYVTRIPVQKPPSAGEQWYRMSRSRTLEEFRSAIDMQGIPIFNVVYADRADNIFWQFNSNLPVRNPKYDWSKAVRGDTSDAVWTRFYKPQELPLLLNPDCGYVYSTNNTPFHTSCDADSLPREKYDNGTQFWEWNNCNNRDLRFRELIAKVDKIDSATMRRIKYDPHYPQNTPEAGTRRTFAIFQKLEAAKYPDISRAIRLCQSWQLRGDTADTIAGLVLNALYPLNAELQNGLAAIERGFDIPENLVVKYLRLAQKRMLKNFGTITPPLGRVQIIKRGTKEMGVNGLPECLHAMYGKVRKDGRVEIELGEDYIGFARFGPNGLESFQTMVPYGASARPGSAHFDDQMPLYVRNQTKAMPITREQVLRASKRSYSPGQ
jgi:acyl-homoserine-lactone acylase